MIEHLDTLLSRLFRWKVNELISDQQVRFQPPDEDWRTIFPAITVNGTPANSLNVYLADLRENRRLRTNERERPYVGGDETPPPRRVDCHYLISAWSPVAVTQSMPNIEPTIDEHALLAETAHVLGQHDPLDPATICAASRPPNLLPIAVPPPLVDEQLPVTLLPVEGFPKIAEFWGTMGDGHRWKPCVYAVITIPLKASPVPAAPMVTTTITDTLRSCRIDAPGSVETRFHIGGTVRDAAAPPLPVGNAWVELLNNAASVRIQFTRTDRVGRFVFANVPAGAYQLRASAHPQGITNLRPITVPEPTGNYDLRF